MFDSSLPWKAPHQDGSSEVDGLPSRLAGRRAPDAGLRYVLFLHRSLLKKAKHADSCHYQRLGWHTQIGAAAVVTALWAGFEFLLQSGLGGSVDPIGF